MDVECLDVGVGLREWLDVGVRGREWLDVGVGGRRATDDVEEQTVQKEVVRLDTGLQRPWGGV